MGNTGGKGRRCDPDSDIMTDMESCDFLGYLCDKHGFPKGGSLSKAKLTTLRLSLTEEKDEMQKKSKKKAKGEDMKGMMEMECCLKQWETECEHGERKQLQKKKRKEKQ